MMMGGGNGRFVRNHADESGFYAVNELFSALSDTPPRWLAPGLLPVEKIQSISVTNPGKEDLAWKVVRATEEGEFAIEGAASGETLDPAAATAFKTLSFAQFNDVVPAAEVEKRALADQKRVVKIVTFEGIIYTITFIPTKPGSVPPPADPENPSPSADDSFLVTIAVSADLPKERKKEEGEKPEDAKTKDEAFAARTKILEQKLAGDKALGGFTFQLGKTAFDQLVKDRAGLLKKPEAPAPAAGGNVPTFRIPPGGLPPGSPPIEATTPPVSIEPEKK